jgi:hypothetical protein
MGQEYFEQRGGLMIEHIKELIQKIQIVKTDHPIDGIIAIKQKDGPDIHVLFKTLTEELAGLNQQDFDPAARGEFTILRLTIRDQYSQGKILNSHKAANDAARMAELLDAYLGAESGGQMRQFPYITNPQVKAIIERDYQELTRRAYPGGSWKSCVILAGSILEGVLADVLTKDATTIAAAMAAPMAPNRPRWAGVGKKDITLLDYANQWTLNDFIKVACHLQIIPYDNEDAIHLVLREYRNLVHPRLELQSGLQVSKAQATTCVGMLDIILDQMK